MKLADGTNPLAKGARAILVWVAAGQWPTVSFGSEAARWACRREHLAAGKLAADV